jgi:alpha-mannosidase
VGDAVEAGYAVHLPLRPVPAAVTDTRPLLRVDNPALVLAAVKLADDRSGDVVARVYESRGGSAVGTVTPGFRAAAVHACDLLEEPLTDPALAPRLERLDDGSCVLRLRPFQVVTLRFRVAAGAHT